MPAVGRYSRLVKPPNSFEPMNESTWVQYMNDVHTQIVCPLFRASRTASYNFTGSTYVVVPYDVEYSDTHDWYSTTTYRYTPRIAGYYFCNASIHLDAANFFQGQWVHLVIRKNSVNELGMIVSAKHDYDRIYTMKTEGLLWLNGKTDYIETALYCQTSGATLMPSSQNDRNYFHAFRVSP